MIIEADDGIDAWDRFLEFEPELCFLDVRMPGLTGIEVARRIAGRAQIVFLAAANDRALPALQAGAVLHLIKPMETALIADVVAQAQAAHTAAAACMRGRRCASCSIGWLASCVGPLRSKPSRPATARSPSG